MSQNTSKNTSKIAILTDGGCDLTRAEVEPRGFTLVPIPLAFPDGSSSDSDHFGKRDFWDTLLSDYHQLPKTSQPTRFSYEDKIKELADAGYEEVLIITISSGLSATYEAALVAAENAVIPTTVFDSRIVTWAMTVLCDAAVRAVNAGLSADQTVKYLTDMRANLCLLFVFDTLEYLVRGGRAGRVAGLVASALDIKPILTFEDDGIIDSVRKTRGRKKAFQAIPAIVNEYYGISDGTDAPSDLKYMMVYSDEKAHADQLYDRMQEESVPGEYVDTVQLGIIVGIYAGPGLGATLYWRDLDPEDYRK